MAWSLKDMDQVFVRDVLPVEQGGGHGYTINNVPGKGQMDVPLWHKDLIDLTSQCLPERCPRP